ncbi:MAG: hypothetical protein LH679_24310 [Cyanobacteria bacterium CAN_BIN43]|nr:hypothetical protein [Cyanobacteria bacterium CAN_BIN43]
MYANREIRQYLHIMLSIGCWAGAIAEWGDRLIPLYRLSWCCCAEAISPAAHWPCYYCDQSLFSVCRCVACVRVA